MLVLLAPLMALIAICIRLDSRGPVLFRQRRLGYDMRPFTVLKFRTMRVDTDQEEHRRYIETTVTHQASPNANGLYKLDRSELGHAGRPASSGRRASTSCRSSSTSSPARCRSSARGRASTTRPRGSPSTTSSGSCCRPGLTGLWQVTARARSTFGEALDMDVAYVRGWSLSLDLRLILKTPFSLLRMRATT